ncbi:hypothetical protein QL285_039646 [Trifolium repens]|nr:hypothetical protein QL285_039646 [Trifolium repens]
MHVSESQVVLHSVKESQAVQDSFMMVTGVVIMQVIEPCTLKLDVVLLMIAISIVSSYDDGAMTYAMTVVGSSPSEVNRRDI